MDSHAFVYSQGYFLYKGEDFPLSPKGNDKLSKYLYWPRQCSASNRLIHAKDHASVQLEIADVDSATGHDADTSKMYVVCGAIRRMGESDDCIVRLTKKYGILAKNY
ncbi:hypothetical protein HW555_000920 [Spodoptera exigua]|uniref:Small ribosomal subunit protein eS21 n=1 Tax=Spodoptera exigua TaxID=7107 RepID=A0A835LAY7_SPOEX|nr:hypothetical protein HW555_000920 [Spodoptera exigua]